MSKRINLSRREVLGLGLGALVLGGGPLLDLSRKRLVKRSFPMMGTTTDIGIVHKDARIAEAAIDVAMNEFTRLQSLLNRYDPRSDVARVDAMPRGAMVPIASETEDVIRNALMWAERSNGAFDPALARVSDLWDVTHRKTPPPLAEVRELAGRHLYRSISVGRNYVVLENKYASLDLGGIGVGYSVDRVVRLLRDRGITDAFINVGGDIFAMGESEDREPWRVGVQDPADPTRLQTTVELSNQAIAVSGDYQQYFDYNGNRYHHIMDGNTAAPRVVRRHSIAVVADHCIQSDAGSTTFFGLTASESDALAKRIGVKIHAYA